MSAFIMYEAFNPKGRMEGKVVNSCEDQDLRELLKNPFSEKFKDSFEHILT